MGNRKIPFVAIFFRFLKTHKAMCCISNKEENYPGKFGAQENVGVFFAYYIKSNG